MKQRNQTQVMNEVDTGASGSFCGGGGGGVTRKSGEIRETERRGDSSGDGIHFFSENMPRHLQGLKEKVQPKIKSSHFSSVVQFIHLDYLSMRCKVLQISAVEMSSSL